MKIDRNWLVLCYCVQLISTLNAYFEILSRILTSYFSSMCLPRGVAGACSNTTHAFTVFRDIDWDPPFGDKELALGSRHECMER